MPNKSSSLFEFDFNCLAKHTVKRKVNTFRRENRLLASPDSHRSSTDFISKFQGSMRSNKVLMTPECVQSPFGRLRTGFSRNTSLRKVPPAYLFQGCGTTLPFPIGHRLPKDARILLILPRSMHRFVRHGWQIHEPWSARSLPSVWHIAKVCPLPAPSK